MKAVNFSLKCMNSSGVVNLTDYKGKPIMITFWVSWCPDCIRDLRAKQILYESIDQDQLVFLTINVVGRETDEDAGKKFMEENQYTFPVLLDEGKKYYDLYACEGVPTTILIDEKFEIFTKYGDKATMTEITVGLSKLLS